MHQRSKYYWPASRVTPSEMALLHAARESSQPRTPISELIARAVRATYGQAHILTMPDKPQTQPMKEAA